ncbi:AraC family transcriptional regulator [Oleomonas cavernae]|uniref:AraC family transcriptional regulator n=1 Tax=Oleomonas cavernae TaxID=2320859 RepID=A0A418VTW6_9PROT|nr:AraC family transcriptional regulator [Oleomonas cavernae]RJF80591.1 AraC family transcriptional regulator [Oleomonas cavernae]
MSPGRQGHEEGAAPAPRHPSISPRIFEGLVAAAHEFRPHRTADPAAGAPGPPTGLDERMTFRDFARQLTQYGRGLGDESLGLMNEPLALGSFHMTTQAVIGEADLHRVWRKYARFNSLVTHAYPIAVADTVDRVLVRWEAVDTTRCHPLFLYVQVLFLQRLSAWMVGRPAIDGTLHVNAQTAPYLDDWAPAIWGRPAPADFFGFSIPKETALLPNVRDHQALSAIMRRPAEYMLFVEETPRLSERVRRILTLRPGEIVSLEEVCCVLNMHSRTLMRRLADEEIRFVELRAQVKCEAAARLLTKSTLPIAEIAAQLGFAEPASFIRLFKRQMGMAPSAFRRQAAATGHW